MIKSRQTDTKKTIYWNISTWKQDTFDKFHRKK